MKNLLKLGKALNKTEQKDFFGGIKPPPPPGLCGNVKPRECNEGEICCTDRGGTSFCTTPYACMSV